MNRYREDLQMAMTDATGGATGGSDPGGADASDETGAKGGGDTTTNSGDIAGVDDGVYQGREDDPDFDTVTPGDEPGASLAAQGAGPPYPGFVDDTILDTPGQLDPAEEGNARMGEGTLRDLGIDEDLRTEMLDNAVAFGLDEQPTNVNDERAFDDGLPGSWSDFSVVSADSPEGTTRFADPNDDAGGEVRGPRVGGAGGFDGGPQRPRPLPGDED